jgi:hypothetical protein
MLPSNKPCSSKTSDDEFKEMVHASKLIPFLLPLIGCLQIRSAFRKGVELLSGPESDPIQSHGTTRESPSKSPSENMEGIGRIPEDSIQLKPDIDKCERWLQSLSNQSQLMQCRIYQKDLVKSCL